MSPKYYDIIYGTPDEVIRRRLEALSVGRESVQNELNQIRNILHKNKQFAEYIADMKLIVLSSSGEEILVTEDTLVGFKDNNELLTARIDLLESELNDINRELTALEK